MPKADVVALALVSDIPAQQGRLLARVAKEGDAVGLAEVGYRACFFMARGFVGIGGGVVIAGGDDLGERKWVGEDVLFGRAGARDLVGWVGVGTDVDLLRDARGAHGACGGM